MISDEDPATGINSKAYQRNKVSKKLFQEQIEMEQDQFGHIDSSDMNNNSSARP